MAALLAGNGFWLNAMPQVWWRRPRSEGTSVRGQKGKFKAMARVINDKAAIKVFSEKWSPALLAIFHEETRTAVSGASEAASSRCFSTIHGLHCDSCKSVHRPIPWTPALP